MNATESLKYLYDPDKGPLCILTYTIVIIGIFSFLAISLKNVLPSTAFKIITSSDFWFGLMCFWIFKPGIGDKYSNNPNWAHKFDGLMSIIFLVGIALFYLCKNSL